MNKANCAGHFSPMVLVFPESSKIETSTDEEIQIRKLEEEILLKGEGIFC